MKSVSIAIIGCGPAGIAAADVLSLNGFSVKIFERTSKAGGMINLIPDIRINKKIITSWIAKLKNQDVIINYNSNIDLNNLDMLKAFDYIIIATGTTKPRSIDGVNGIHATDFLQSSCMSNQNIAVIGGGNVALDCACYSAQSSCNTTIYYRRSKEVMPASKREIELAKSLGVNFKFEFTDYKNIIADKIIFAIGTDPDIPNGIESDRIFLCGDAKIGASSIAQAIKNAKQLAQVILNLT